jgi:hypothetical protein
LGVVPAGVAGGVFGPFPGRYRVGSSSGSPALVGCKYPDVSVVDPVLVASATWVGVGAQAAGVNSPRSGLKDWDKTRYGSLVHPGDAYSYDIFSQAARVVRESKTPDVLGGVTVRKVIATGRSQSAFRLVTYINAVHPVTHLFDGYLVHSRGANASGFAAEGLARDAENAVPPGAHIRADIDVPVLDLQTEGDMVALRAHLTHQPPFARYR